MSQRCQVVFLVDESICRDTSSNSTKLITQTCLRMLTYFSSCYGESSNDVACGSSGRVNPIEWGVGFFRSAGKSDRCLRSNVIERRVCKGFREFSLNSFEEFEEELVDSLKVAEKIDKTETNGNSDPINLQDYLNTVKSALQRVTIDFSWDRPDITSPMKTSLRFSKKNKSFTDRSESCLKRNFVYIIAKWPDISNEVVEQLKKECNDVNHMKHMLVPPHTYKELTDSLQMKVYWIDMKVSCRIVLKKVCSM